MIATTKQKITNYIKFRGRARVHDLIEKLSFSRVAVHKQLRKMMQDGLLAKEGKPPLVYYVLKIKREEDLKKIIRPILRHYQVKKASLFGSVARGDETKQSDIDILVDFPRKKSLLDFINLKLKLEEALGREVDLVEFSTIKPLIRETILANQVSIL